LTGKSNSDAYSTLELGLPLNRLWLRIDFLFVCPVRDLQVGVLPPNTVGHLDAKL